LKSLEKKEIARKTKGKEGQKGRKKRERREEKVLFSGNAPR
jgi:hypothetical protein